MFLNHTSYQMCVGVRLRPLSLVPRPYFYFIVSGDKKYFISIVN